jgi:hypothetical protein
MAVGSRNRQRRYRRTLRGHRRTLRAWILWGFVAASQIALVPENASAQASSPNQPDAIPTRSGLTPPPCPRIGPTGTIQPLRIQPRQVAAKNGRGCLSAEDAVYGPDGCPIRFCGQRTPRLQLPAP